MILYKCIPFAKDYWPYIAKEKRIRFATIPALWTGNDESEFRHKWDSEAQFFRRYGSSLKANYDSLFEKTVVLSMSKTPSKKYWDEYCSQGGVRYEFEYDETYFRKSEVNSSDFVYNYNKTLSLPNYLVAKESDPNIKYLLQKGSLTRCELVRLFLWLKSGAPNKNSLDHIVQEMVVPCSSSLPGWRFPIPQGFLIG